jgi:CDP-glycerol glycerophosphotransferase (TagB/SpsB family)
MVRYREDEHQCHAFQEGYYHHAGNVPHHTAPHVASVRAPSVSERRMSVQHHRQAALPSRQQYSQQYRHRWDTVVSEGKNYHHKSSSNQQYHRINNGEWQVEGNRGVTNTTNNNGSEMGSDSNSRNKCQSEQHRNIRM